MFDTTCTSIYKNNGFSKNIYYIIYKNIHFLICIQTFCFILITHSTLHSSIYIKALHFLIALGIKFPRSDTVEYIN